MAWHTRNFDVKRKRTFPRKTKKWNQRVRWAKRERQLLTVEECELHMVFLQLWWTWAKSVSENSWRLSRNIWARLNSMKGHESLGECMGVQTKRSRELKLFSVSFRSCMARVLLIRHARITHNKWDITHTHSGSSHTYQLFLWTNLLQVFWLNY